MTCNLESSSQPVIKWFREATEIKQGGRYTIQTTKDPKGPNMYIIVLTIKDPAPADGGVYKCVASNENGESNANITLNFQDTEKTEPAGKAPNFKEKPKISQDASGKNIHIECSCTADPKPTITWYKGSTLLKENNRLKLKTTQDKENYSFMLDILNFTKDDAGVYKVVAKNAHGEGTANITLNLDAQQKDKDAEKDAEKDKEKKTITLTDKATTKVELDKKRVTFEQKVDSKEKPTAQWFFGNSPLKSGGRYKMDVSQKDASYYASMQVDEVTTKDAGPYKCVIQTPFGEAVQLMKLSSTQLIPPKVKGDAPKFITKLTSKTFTIGEAMDITLKVSGTEPITTTWYFNDKEIKGSSAVNISYERGTARFYMSKVTPKDAGVYTVELKNAVGSEKGSANMIVKEDEKKKQREEEMQRKEEERKKQEEREKLEMEEKEKKKKEDDKKKEEEKKKLELKKQEEEKKKAEEDKKKKETDDKKKKEDDEKKKKEEEEKKKKEEEEKKKKEEEEKKKKEEEEKKKKEEEEKKKKEKAAPKAAEPEPKEEAPAPAPQQPLPTVNEPIADEEAGKEREDGRRASKAQKGARPPGPTFAKPAENKVVVEGQTLKCSFKIDTNDCPMPKVKFYRAGREIVNDTRCAIRVNDLLNCASLEIKKTKIQDEAKYSVVLEHDGYTSDTTSFSVFIKDPKDSSLDFRSLLKHRGDKKTADDDDDLDWGQLKPVKRDKADDGNLKGNHQLKKIDKGQTVDKSGRRLSQIELTRMSLKKTEKAGSDSEDEKKDSASRRQSVESTDLPIMKVSAEKLEALENQRRNSRQMRRASLADVIPDWPTLQHRIKEKEAPENFLKELEDIKVMEGTEKVQFATTFCRPGAKVQWFKNKMDIFHGGKYHIENEGDDYTLTILNVKLEDGGKYICQVNNSISSGWLYVEAKEPEYHFTKKLPQHHEVVRKKDTQLECFVSDPRAKVKWFRMGEPIEFEPGKYEMQRRENRCILKIKNVGPGDEAEYSCVCGKASTYCDLYVEEPEWDFFKQLDDVEATEREKAVLQCDVNDKEAEVTWFKGDKEIKPEEEPDKFEVEKDGMKRKLIIKDVTLKDEGPYTCKVLDKTSTAELFVEPDIKFSKKLTDTSVKEEDTICLECVATNPHGQPIVWTKDGKPLSPSNRIQELHDGDKHTLLIKDASMKDAGMYACKFGERATRAEVKVDEKPRPPKLDPTRIPHEIIVKRGEKIQLDIPYQAVPIPKASWKKDGVNLSSADLDMEISDKFTSLTIPDAQRSDSGEYELTLTNSIGSDKIPIKVKVIDKPTPPGAPLDVADIFKDKCLLSWKKPKDDGGCPIKHYIVEKMDTSTDEWVEVAKVNELQCRVKGLTPSHRYQFRVKAVNSEGQSKPLNTDGEILAKDPWSPADKPGKPEVVDTDRDFVKLKWKAPKNDGGAPIEGYLIQKKLKGSDDWEDAKEVPVDEKETTVKGLKENKEYDFRVIAKNRAGNSIPSATSGPVLTRPRKVKPRIDTKSLRDVKIKRDQTFSLEPEFVGEPPPTVTWVKKGLDGKTVPVESTSIITIENKEKRSTLSCKKGVRSDTGEYTITIQNEHGSDSATVNVIVLSGPARPEGPLEVSNITKDSATLTWKAPADKGGSDITGYVVEKFDPTKGKWEKVSNAVSGTKVTVPKLQDGHEYKFRVMAENVHGLSEPLETDKSIIAKNPFNEPHPPSQPTIVDHDRTHIDLKWDKPENDGGAPITGYDIERKETKSNRWVKVNRSPVSETNFTDDKVVEGKEYEYRVKAVNKAGESDPSLVSKPVTAKPSKEKPKVNLDSLFGAREIRVRAGEPLTIPLGISGAPTPTVIWQKNGKPVGPRAETTNSETDAKLYVPCAERGDSGKYTVNISNPLGTDTADIQVVVLDKPGIPGEPMEIKDVTADSCKLSWNPPADLGGVDVSGYILEKCEEGSNFWEKVPGLIAGTSHTVKGLKDGKSYQFRVKAENMYGVSEPLVSKKVVAKNPFDAPDAPHGVEITKFDRSSCSLKWKAPSSDGGNPIKGYIVEKKERKDKDWVKACVFPTPDTNFTVLNLTEGQDVEFRVSAVNDAGPGKPSKTTPPHLVRDPVFPAGSPSSPSLDKITKDSVTLSWTPPKNDGGSKIIGYTVEKKGKDGKWVPCTRAPVDGTSFTVTKLPEGEEMQFRVIAENAAGPGEPSKPTQAVVIEDQPEKPTIDLSGIKDITVKAGQDFKLAIPFTGVPKPTTTWMRDGEPVKENTRTDMKTTKNSAELETVKATRNDAGRYTLNLKNASGSDSVSVKVNVLDRPTAPNGPFIATDIDGESLMLQWQPPKDDGGNPINNYILEKKKTGTNRWTKCSSFINAPKFTVRNLEPGCEYDFRVMAENDQGVSDALETDEAVLAKLPYDPPSTPGVPKCVSTTEDSITLQWNPPKKDGGSPLFGYIIEKREKGDTKWTKANHSEIPEEEFTVRGLTEGKDYEFRVCAVNAAGPGQFSECSEAIKARPPPVAPKINFDYLTRDVTAILGEEFKIVIPFTGNPIPDSTWKLGKASVADDPRVKINSSPDQIVMVNRKAEMTDAGKYNITLSNEKGFDTVSVNVTIVDKPSKPEAPLEVSEITPDSCCLTWNPPKDNGGSIISNYVVEKMDVAKGKWEPCSRFVRGTTYEVMGLTEGHSYKFRVSAENEYGVGEPLESAMPIVAAHQYTTPQAPATPEIMDVDEKSVSLAWSRPKDDGGKKVQGYIVEYKEAGTNKWKPATDFAVKDTMYTVDGLKKDCEYEFRVRAKNIAGVGEPSNSTGTVMCKPKYTKPSSCTKPYATNVGQSFVELKWDKPRQDGGSKITGYIIERKDPHSNQWIKANDYPVIDTSYTVSNLPENSEHEFRVCAVNAGGVGEPSPPSGPIKVKEKIVGCIPEFTKKLMNTTAPQGGTATFQVEVYGKPDPEIRWLKNGLEFGSSSRASVKRDGDRYTLTLSDVNPSDAGDITCEISNPSGFTTTSCNFVVKSPPSFGKTIEDQVCEIGEQFKLKVPFSGTGPFDFKLKKDGKEIPEGDRVRISVFDDYAVVVLKDNGKDDSGKYTLDLGNESGHASSSFNFKVVSPPAAPEGPLDVSEITKHTCHLSWKPPKEDGGSRVKHYVIERQEVGKPYWITVSSACKDTHFDVQGLYENSVYNFRVSAVNDYGTGDFITTASPIVAKMPFDAPGIPGVPDVTEVGGDFVSLSWDKPSTDGGGKILGYWIEKKEHGSENWSRVNLQPCIPTMFNIPNLIEDRKYEFRVFAENEAGMSKPSLASKVVKVKDPKAAVIPEFSSHLKKMVGVEGKSITFECSVHGTPKPEITWFKGVREIYDGPKYTIENDGEKYTLTINDIFGEDADEYSIRATNKGGSRNSRADLEIKSSPKINVPPRFRDISTFEKGESVVLKIPFTGNPKPTVKWIRDGEELRGAHYHVEITDRHAILTIKDANKDDDGPYRLSLENDLGADSAIIKIQINDRPDPPRFPVVENIRDDSVVLSWKPPLNDGGSFITDYIIEKREPPHQNWVKCASTRMSFHNITGLSNEKEYEFRVIAENFYGRSDPCEETEAIRTDIPEDVKKKKQREDEFGRKIRSSYTGPKINDYDKFYEDIWKKYVPQPVEIKSGSVYDYYDILEELGSGAFGVVHRCIEKSTGRVFVAKFINTPYPLDKVTVRNEINVMNHLHHPQLMNLHDAFDDKYEMVLIFEFLSGGELFDRIAAEDYKMSEAEVINYMRQVCEGLKHMHENSIVHLDIKPENIMCETKKSTQVKIIDFGLATKLNPDEIVKVTTATAEFAAPEIVDREAVGFYTDMWAVGVLAYVLLSGLSPFAGEDDLETLQNVKRCDWDFDEEAFSNVSAEAKDFIKRLLLRNPAKRLTVHEAIDHAWLKGDHSNLTHRIPSSRYNKIRQKIKEKYADWPQPMPAIGRIANFSSLRKHRPKEYQIYDTYFDRREAIPRFVRKPRNVLAGEGQIAKFDCKVIAVSPPIITWAKEDSILTQSVKHMQKYNNNEYELKISRLKVDDKGEYVVRAENSFGCREEVAILKVEPMREVSRQPSSREGTPRRKVRVSQERAVEKPKDIPPSFTFDLRERLIQLGVGFKLLCTVAALPHPKVTWLKDGKEIKTGDHYMVTYSYGICSLEVHTAELSDAGKYTCIAENSLGEVQSSCRVNVEDRIGDVKQKPIGLDLSKQKQSRITRVARRTKNLDDMLNSLDNEESSSRHSSRTTTTSEDGTIRTTTTVHSSSSSSRTTHKNEIDLPKFTKPLQSQALNEGDKLTLKCTVESSEEPDIEWSINDRIIKSNVASQTYSNGVCTLQLPELLPSDSGKYVCKATNSAGESSTSATVHVKVIEKPAITEIGNPPCVTKPLTGLVVKDGDAVSLICEITGMPKPSITWLHGGNKIENSEEFAYENSDDTYKLIIAEVFPEDAGIYSCEASNEAGRTSCCCTLKVIVPDDEVVGLTFATFPQSLSIEEGTLARFSCSFEESNVKVTWKKNDDEIENTGRFKFTENDNEFGFEIPAALATDSGVYKVAAKDSNDVVSLWTFSLNVTVTDTASPAHVDVQELLKSIE
ncbi:twitchin isoform X2 [Octopus bimaculoides]|uniref:twitchin isoform X2 n=1 Tax=Octopus bimaculoides TaxID=37653 RepID=UPI0022E000A2|nr:twitchin isoform X2 [Octopus bimaculoides]